MDKTDPIILAHSLCRRNKELLKDRQIGCFFCNSVDIDYNSIDEWVGNNENTALCPKCGIDSLIPMGDLEVDSVKFNASKEFLRGMSLHWFKKLYKRDV